MGTTEDTEDAEKSKAKSVNHRGLREHRGE